MLITADKSTKTLVVGPETYAAKAPGVFDVPEHVGRTLTAFSHFSVADHALAHYLPEKEEKPVKKTVKRRTTTRKKA